MGRISNNNPLLSFLNKYLDTQTTTMETPPQETYPKVLIGIITYDSDWYCLKDFAESVAQLEKPEGTDIIIVDNSDNTKYMKQLQKFFPSAHLFYYEPPSDKKGFYKFRHCEVECRKIVKEHVVKSDYTHLFFLDSDVLCEPDVLTKLLKHEKDIVCGLFRYKDPPEGRPVWFKVKRPPEISSKTGVWLLDFIPNKALTDKLMEIDACGFGAILIKTKVLQKVELKKSPNDHYGADIHFCFDAKKAGYKIFGDPLAKANHLYKACARRRESNAKAF